ncbi:MAG: diguanylate cyclase [Oscillospiraceae bacterium]|nr:diguanylate cyclase [Oscillospiraceae bacterium]
MKIRTMLIISMAVFSLFSMVLFTTVVGVTLSKSSEAQYKEMMRELSEKQAYTVEEVFALYEHRTELIIGSPGVVDYIAYVEAGGFSADVDDDEEEIANLALDEDSPKDKALHTLAAFMHKGSGITGITVYDTRSDPGDNLANEPLLSVGADHRAFLTSVRRAQLEEHGDDLFAIVSAGSQNKFDLLRHVKIADNYYMVCTFAGDDFEMLLSRSRLPFGGKTIFICPLRNLLDNHLRGNLDEGMMGSPEYIRINEFTQQDRFINGGEFFTYDYGRENYSALFDKIGDTGWLIGVVSKTENMYVHSTDAVQVMLNVTIFLGAALTILSILFVLKYTKPLMVIKEALVRIRRGDHEIRINVPATSEYGDLASEFNALLDNVVVGEGRYKTVVEMSDSIVFEWNFQTGNVFFSSNFGKKFSYRAPTDSYEDSFLAKCKVHPEDADNYKKTLEKLSKGEEIRQDEFRWKNIFGDYVWVLIRSGAIHDAEGNIVKVVGVIIDIDRAKKSEKILSARASYDALTSLYNRATLEELINNEIELIAARKNEFAILFIDVDDFKFFNDNYSHATGDQVLRFTAISINDIISKYGMAGRFGGDEFVVCIRNAEINDPAKTAEEILAKLKDGFVCDVGDRLSVNVSIGIAVIKDTTKKVDEIIGMADTAMYNIKKKGKSNYGFIN